MRFLLITLYILFTFHRNLAFGARDSTFCKKLRLIAITNHLKENFDVYMFLEIEKDNSQKDSIFYFVFVDSIQKSFYSESKKIKTKNPKVGKYYNICLKRLFVYDRILSHPEGDIRGMDIYNYKNYYGDVFITNDIQNGKIINRKSRDTLDYFKRFPIYLHGYP